MAPTRYRLEDIIEIAQRSRGMHRWLAAFRPKELRLTFQQLRKEGNQQLTVLLPYFPISAVTAIEVFFRESIKEIIDSGDPFLGRAEQLGKNIKFDLTLIRALQGRQITVGEVISHGLALQSLENIGGAMSGLTQMDFFAELSSVRDRGRIEIQKMPDKPIIDDIDQLCRTMARLLEVRHIVVHELPNDLPFTVDDVASFLEMTDNFLRASYWYVTNVLTPNAPLTQSDMAVAAGKDFDKAEEEVQKLVAQVKSRVGKERALPFQEYQDVWEHSRDLNADFESSEYEGGSIRPMIHYLALTRATRERIESLQKTLERIPPES